MPPSAASASTTPSAPAPTPPRRSARGTARTSGGSCTPTCRSTDTPGTAPRPCRRDALARVHLPEVRRGRHPRGPPRVALVLDPHEAEPLGGAESMRARSTASVAHHAGAPSGEAVFAGATARGGGRDRGRRRDGLVGADDRRFRERRAGLGVGRPGVRHSRFRARDGRGGHEGDRRRHGGSARTVGLSSASEVTPSRCQIQRVTWNFKYVCAFSKCLRCVQTVRHCRNRRERVRAQPSENLVFAEYSVFQQNDASMSRKVTGSETARAMFGSLLGSTADADEAYASRLRARLALETEGLDADGAAVLRELRRLEADDPSSPRGRGRRAGAPRGGHGHGGSRHDRPSRAPGEESIGVPAQDPELAQGCAR